MEDSRESSLALNLLFGLVKDRVVVQNTSQLTLKSLKSLASDFVNEKIPDHKVTRLKERLIIYRHDYSTTNILQVSHKLSTRRGSQLIIIINKF